MKNTSKKPLEQEEFSGAIREHEHIHAANCGHPSVVHGDHVDYLHDGHYHYYLEGKTYECEGPKAAKVIPFKKK